MLRLDEQTLSTFETPCYLYDPAEVCASYRRLRESLGTGLVVSVKANPNRNLFERTASIFQDGVEVGSLRELELVQGQGTAPRYVNTPGLDETLCLAARRSEAILILDNPNQAELAMKVSGLDGGHPGVFLRLNAHHLAKTAGRAAHDEGDHFGMDIGTAAAVAQRLEQRGIHVTGLHTFAGSLTWPGCSILLVRGIRDALRCLEQIVSHAIRTINLGGGFPTDTLDESHLGLYRESLQTLGADRSLLHEAGRAIFATSGMFVVRVIAVKRIDSRTVAVCDGGLAQNFLLCRTERFVKNFDAPTLVPFGGGDRGVAADGVTLVGCSCNVGDIIGKVAPGAPMPRAGDRYVFARCGAYNATYTLSGFLGLPPAVSYLLS